MEPPHHLFSSGLTPWLNRTDSSSTSGSTSGSSAHTVSSVLSATTAIAAALAGNATFGGARHSTAIVRSTSHNGSGSSRGASARKQRAVRSDSATADEFWHVYTGFNEDNNMVAFMKYADASTATNKKFMRFSTGAEALVAADLHGFRLEITDEDLNRSAAEPLRLISTSSAAHTTARPAAAAGTKRASTTGDSGGSSSKRQSIGVQSVHITTAVPETDDALEFWGYKRASPSAVAAAKPAPKRRRAHAGGHSVQQLLLGLRVQLLQHQRRQQAVSEPMLLLVVVVVVAAVRDVLLGSSLRTLCSTAMQCALATLR
jgi:hypothetical protein